MKPNRFTIKNLTTGFLYFYIHFVTEVACFFALARYVESAPIAWLISFAYDMLAFAPQGLFGYISDKFRKVAFGVPGLALLAAALLIQKYTPWTMRELSQTAG